MLTADKQYEERNKLFRFSRSIGLPTKLADIDATPDDLDTMTAKALAGIDVRVWPWKVTAEIIKAAVMELEEYNAEVDKQN